MMVFLKFHKSSFSTWVFLLLPICQVLDCDFWCHYFSQFSGKTEALGINDGRVIFDDKSMIFSIKNFDKKLALIFGPADFVNQEFWLRNKHLALKFLGSVDEKSVALVNIELPHQYLSNVAKIDDNTAATVIDMLSFLENVRKRYKSTFYINFILFEKFVFFKT